MLPVLVQDISGCNHGKGTIMKYTLPFLLCIFIRLVATSSYHTFTRSIAFHFQEDSIEASCLKQLTFLHSDEAPS